MNPLARLRSFISALLRRDRFEDGMRDELRFHIDAYADDLVRAAARASSSELSSPSRKSAGRAAA